MYGKTKDTSEQEFIAFLKSVGTDSVEFDYVSNCNDEFNPCDTIKRQATYEFYVIAGGFKKLIVLKNHRRTHEEVENELLKKFNRWVERWRNER